MWPGRLPDFPPTHLACLPPQQEPSIFDAAGRPLLKFGRLLLGRTHRLRINLKNNGIMAAGARLEAAHHEHFSILEGPQVFSVDSKRAQTFTAEFRPTAIGQFQHEVCRGADGE